MPAAGARAPLEVRIDSKMFHRPGAAPVEALRGFALDLPAGAIGALVGPSGCGKTTAMRIIAGLDRDFTGAVRGAGDTLGMVFQEPRLLPWRTVQENILIVSDAAGMKPELDVLLATLGLSDHRHRYPSELSLGLARRAAIARAFAVEPALLLLDEPFVSLDEATLGQIREALLALHARHAPTTLVVTHDLSQAAGLADRVFLVSARPGRVLRTIDIAEPRGPGRAAAAERIRRAVSGGGRTGEP